jgi:hypothetical protein
MSDELDRLARLAVRQKEEEDRKLAAMSPEERERYIDEWAARVAPGLVEDGCAIDRMTRHGPPGGTPNRPHCLVHDEGLPLQTCTCGAASRSEQSAGTIDVCSCGDCDGTPHPGSEGHLYSRPWPAAEAAQSPQVGAAERRQVSPGDFGRPVRFEIEHEDGTIVRYRGKEAALHVGALNAACSLVGNRIRWPEMLPEVSRAQPAAGPPVNPPVASADQELARLLREVRTEIAWWLDEHRCCRGHEGDLLARIDSALSRLAGQSATANEERNGK